MERKTLNPQIEALYALLIPAVVVGILGTVLSIIFGYANRVLPLAGLVVFPLLVYIYYESTEYEITDDKVILNRNIGGEIHKEVQFDKIQNTKITQPFLYKLTGNYGNIYISTAGSDLTAIKLLSIEDPKKTNRKIVNEIRAGSNSDDESNLDDTSLLYTEYQKLREASDELKDNIIGGNYE